MNLFRFVTVAAFTLLPLRGMTTSSSQPGLKANAGACEIIGNETLSILTAGKFEISKVEHFSGICLKSKELKESQKVDSPFCVLTVKRLTAAGDSRFDAAKSYLVSGIESSCTKKLGGKIDLQMINRTDEGYRTPCADLKEADYMALGGFKTWQAISPEKMDCYKQKILKSNPTNKLIETGTEDAPRSGVSNAH